MSRLTNCNRNVCVYVTCLLRLCVLLLHVHERACEKKREKGEKSGSSRACASCKLLIVNCRRSVIAWEIRKLFCRCGCNFPLPGKNREIRNGKLGSRERFPLGHSCFQLPQSSFVTTDCPDERFRSRHRRDIVFCRRIFVWSLFSYRNREIFFLCDDLRSRVASVVWRAFRYLRFLLRSGVRFWSSDTRLLATIRYPFSRMLSVSGAALSSFSTHPRVRRVVQS